MHFVTNIFFFPFLVHGRSTLVFITNISGLFLVVYIRSWTYGRFTLEDLVSRGVPMALIPTDPIRYPIPCFPFTPLAWVFYILFSFSHQRSIFYFMPCGPWPLLQLRACISPRFTRWLGFFVLVMELRYDSGLVLLNLAYIRSPCWVRAILIWIQI